VTLYSPTTEWPGYAHRARRDHSGRARRSFGAGSRADRRAGRSVSPAMERCTRADPGELASGTAHCARLQRRHARCCWRGCHQLSVPRRELATEAGEVVHSSSGRRLAYASLATKASSLAPPGAPRLRIRQNTATSGVLYLASTYRRRCAARACLRPTSSVRACSTPARG